MAENRHENDRLWQELKKQVVSLLLAWPYLVTVTLRDNLSAQKLVIRNASKSTSSFPESVQVGYIDVLDVCNVLSQASFISSDDRPSWVHVGALVPELEITGAISLKPNASKQAQFLAFGIHPLVLSEGQNILYSEINSLFRDSAFGVEDETGRRDNGATKNRRNKRDTYTNKELVAGKKGVDRWPMFYINIHPVVRSENLGSFDVEDVLNDRGSSLSTILELLRVVISQFLSQHHLKPDTSKHPRRVDLPLINTMSEAECANKSSAPSEETPSATAGSLRANLVETLAPQTLDESQRQKNASQTPNERFDMLGKNVKLPSFHSQIPRRDFTLDAWSRTKSGALTSYLQSTNDRGRAYTDTNWKSRSESSTCIEAVSVQTPSSTADKDLLLRSEFLVSNTGKLTRAPFEDVSSSASRHCSGLTQEESAHQRPAREYSIIAQGTQGTPTRGHTTPATFEADDETIAWINPVTKTKSLVDRRTGLTVPYKRCKVRKDSDGTSDRIAPRKLGRLTIQSHSKGSHKPPSNMVPQESPWIDGILAGWDNPVFQPAETVIPVVSTSSHSIDSAIAPPHHDGHQCSGLNVSQAIQQSFGGVDGRIFKDALRNAEVISQVDKKFILVKLHMSATNTHDQSGNRGSTLVIIDQHAADERIRIENLMSELCSAKTWRLANQTVLSEPSIFAIPLEKPLTFDISVKEAHLFEKHQTRFAEWGVYYDTTSGSQISLGDRRNPVKDFQRITVRILPPGISERCKLDPKLLINLLRTDLWAQEDHGTRTKNQTTTNADPQSQAAGTDSKHAWLQQIHHCPRGILDLLNSRACRSSIMFNDELSKSQCQTLIGNLASCAFPFQCAHGRPSMVPLVDLGTLA